MRFGLLHGILLAALPIAAFCQPPAIDQEGVRNAASQMPPSLAGGAIAPGALVTIHGLRLAAENSATRVSVHQKSSDLDALLISATAERLELRMPRQLQTGAAELVVTHDGQSSRPYSLRIAPGVFGIFARNGKGWGQGEIFNGSETPNTPSVPAHPGGTATILGTGLGTARAVEVFAGGKRAARVLSRGPRRGRTGVEQIRFQLARDTPAGCYVPVLIKLGEIVSNAVTMSIAGKGQRCEEIAAPNALVLLARLMLHVQLGAGTPVDFAESVGAAIFPSPDDAGTLRDALQLLPPVGTCTAYTGRWAAPPSLTALAGLLSQSTGPGRDAGPRIAVTGPKTTLPLEPWPNRQGLYTGKTLVLDPGGYRVSGPGGEDIGAFSTEIHATAQLEWKHPERLDTIDRARGVTVEWQGATAEQHVIVAGINVDPFSGAAGIGLCVAPGETGRGELPPLALANLPASQAMPGVPMNYLFLATIPAKAPQPFRTRGVENGMALFTAVRGRTINYR